jgi:hypothetical protein
VRESAIVGPVWPPEYYEILFLFSVAPLLFGLRTLVSEMRPSLVL